MGLSSRQLVHILKAIFNHYSIDFIWDDKVYIRLMFFLCFNRGLQKYLRKPKIPYYRLFNEFLKEGFTYNDIVKRFEVTLDQPYVDDLVYIHYDEIF